MSLASVKSRLVLPFWYRLTRVVLPEKGPLNVCARVCIIIRNVAGVSGDGAYCKDSVGALAECAVVGRVDRRLSSEPRVKLTHVRLVALHQDTKRTTF